MGCSGSKAENSPLVVRCRQRRELMRAAANHRYALAAAHVSYFSSLKEVGDALRKFFDEELISTYPSSSSVSSPSVIFPPAPKVKTNHDESLYLHEDEDEDEEESHLNISDSSSDNDADSESEYKHQHDDHDSDNDERQHHNHRSHVHKEKSFNGGVKSFHTENASSSNYLGRGFYGHGLGSHMEPYMDQPWFNANNSIVYYMKKSAPVMKTVVQEPPAQPSHGYSGSYWNSPAGHGVDYCYFPTSPVLVMGNRKSVNVNLKKEAPPPPSPKVSIWDSFNVFDGVYKGYNTTARYGYGWSPNSSDVREMDRIPDLEEETEDELYKESKKTNIEPKKSSKGGTSSSESEPLWSSEENKKPQISLQYSGESTKKSTPPQCSEDKLSVDQYPNGDIEGSINLTDERSSPETLVSKSSVKKKGETSEVEWTSKVKADSSRLSSVTMLSPHGKRDLREVMAEIRDDFVIASSYGKEVAMMLEVGKLPHQPGFLKELMLRDSSSTESIKLASQSMKFTNSYFDDVGKDMNANVCNLSSILDKLYAWEKKLYEEVKEEERLRVKYEKWLKRLKILDKEGKIYAAQAYIGRLVTKLDVSIKAIDAISIRIHKLRDEELQPKISALMDGLMRMWKAMLKCHQKQFQAIMESKNRTFKAKTTPQTVSNSSSAMAELEKELRSWYHHFNDWIKFQKSFAELLNGWLMKCLHCKPDGLVPYSPGQLGAPPVFVICNDWHQAMEAISEGRVTKAMNSFASSLQQLREKQDEEEHLRLKAENLSNEYGKLLEVWKREHQRRTMLDKNGSTLDDLKLNLDSLRRRLSVERVKQKDAMKLVQNMASSSLQGGLVPTFRALEMFASEALKAHERIRLQHPHHSL